MSTTAIGDDLEEKIHALLEAEINADRFWAKRANCKLFRRKGYFSKDRDGHIVFDVSIEIYLPGASQYAVLVLIECKHYTHAVPVDDVEEFYAKVQQVAAANAKAVLASTATFQSGTKKFAKSKGIGLLRYFDPMNFKWELNRSPSACAGSINADKAPVISEGLSSETFESQIFDLYMQSPTRDTNSLWDFVEDLVVVDTLSTLQVRQIANPRSRLASSVPYLEKAELETKAEDTLLDIGYLHGAPSLDAICERESQRCGLTVVTSVRPLVKALSSPILGRIQFDILKIEIFSQPMSSRGRDRFTLAHELAHHLLGHGSYMKRDSCDESDLFLGRGNLDEIIDLSRMEFQANYYAASLLMPRANFVRSFYRVLRRLDLANRGHSPLYVDNQPCNLQSYQTVIGHLTQGFRVSRTAATIRLEGLGLLRDARNRKLPHSIASPFIVRDIDNPFSLGPDGEYSAI